MSSAAPPPQRRELSPAQRTAAQRIFYLFNLFNVCSFQCLSGNLITLYGLRVGLGSVMIGLLLACIPLAQFMPIAGRIFVNRFGNVRSMGVFWIARYVLAAPLLAVSLFAGAGQTRAAVVLLFIGVLGFNLARGLGMTGMQPVIGHLTTPEDRGLFMSRMQLVIHGVIVVTGLLMGLILDRESPLVVFTIILAVGVVTGVISIFYVFRLPEPPREPRAAPFLPAASAALRDATVRRFLILVLAVFAGSFMVTPFFILFLRQVYGMGDDAIMLITVVGSFGAIVMALLSGLMTDRIGAQPLLVLSACLMGAVMLPLVVAPPLPAPAAWAYGAAAFFLFLLGTSGMQSASTVYFLSICKAEERLNLGVLYMTATGLGGVLGSLAGGALLDLLGRALGETGSFRAFFAVLTVLFALIAVGMNGLQRLGAYRARDVLSIMFSIRDLRALGLLNRLQRVRSPFEEQQLIQELGSSRSRVTARDLMRKLSSPRFAVRAEALTALSTVETREDLAPALIAELRDHDFTTAYLAAELAGQKGITEAIPALRESLGSADFFLAGKAMVALARLGDRSSLPRIERLLADTDNPRLIIHAATALELFDSPTSIPVLMAKLDRRFSPYVRDELILAIAAILGAAGFLYPHYRHFMDSASAGVQSLRDALAMPRRPPPLRERVEKLLDLTIKDRARFARTARPLLADAALADAGAAASGGIAAPGTRAAEHLAAGLDDRELLRLDRFRFLVAALITWAAIRAPADAPAASA